MTLEAHLILTWARPGHGVGDVLDDRALSRVRRRLKIVLPDMQWWRYRDRFQSSGDPGAGHVGAGNLADLGRTLRDAVVAGLGPDLAGDVRVQVHLRRNGGSGAGLPERYDLG